MSGCTADRESAPAHGVYGRSDARLITDSSEAFLLSPLLTGGAFNSLLKYLFAVLKKTLYSEVCAFCFVISVPLSICAAAGVCDSLSGEPFVLYGINAMGSIRQVQANHTQL